MQPIRKVMLVDDEPDIRRVGQMSLELMGRLQVVLAASGAEAVELAARELPDVILLDVMMPGLDGPATLTRLLQQEATRRIPVIFMTALGQADGELGALGAAGVIRKPFDPVKLVQEIGTIASRWSGPQEPFVA